MSIAKETPGTRLRDARRKKYPTATAAARALGLKVSTYTSHENGTRKYEPEDAEYYGRVFDVDPAYLLLGNKAEAGDQASAAGGRQPRPKSNASFPPVYQEFSQARKIPLLGQTAGGTSGRFVLNGMKIGDVFCPPGLENVPNAYAVMIYGTSMEPRFMAGETAWLNPQAPVRSGDDVVVQLAGDHEGDDMESYVKQFRSLSSKTLKLWQHNPEEGEPHELEFDATRVFSIHKIVYHAMV